MADETKKKKKKKKNKVKKCVHTFINIEDLPGDSNLSVHYLKQDTDNLAEALGITPERMQSIMKFSDEAIKASTDLVEAISKLNGEMKHANELVFCTVYISRKTASGQVVMGNGGLEGFLQFLARRGSR